MPCRRRFLMFLVMVPAVFYGSVSLAQSDPPQLSLAVLDSMPLPTGNVTGLAWMSVDTILVLTEIPDSLSETESRRVILTWQDPFGEIMRQEDFTGTLDRGLAWNGEFIWAFGDESGGGSLLYKIEPDTCIVKDAFSTSTHRPCGLSCDEQFIWFVDRDSGRLYRFDVETENVARSIVAPAFSPFGLAWDGTFAWVSDSGTGRLYRLRGRQRALNGIVDAADFNFRGRDVILAWGDGALWFVPEGSTQAYRTIFQ